MTEPLSALRASGTVKRCPASAQAIGPGLADRWPAGGIAGAPTGGGRRSPPLTGTALSRSPRRTGLYWVKADVLGVGDERSTRSSLGSRVVRGPAPGAKVSRVPRDGSRAPPHG